MARSSGKSKTQHKEVSTMTKTFCTKCGQPAAPPTKEQKIAMLREELRELRQDVKDNLRCYQQDRKELDRQEQLLFRERIAEADREIRDEDRLKAELAKLGVKLDGKKAVAKPARRVFKGKGKKSGGR